MANRFEKTDSRRPGKPHRPEAATDNAAVAKPTAAFASLHHELKLIHTLLAGTSAMIAAGKEYMPQHDYESDRHYKTRLKGTVLDNFVQTTLGTWVGKAFARPPEPNVQDPPPEVVLRLFEDVDGAGTAFVPFVREWFRSGLRDREAYALIDYSAAQQPSNGETLTKADDASTRCTWRLIAACDMLEYREDAGRCTMLRFRDDRMVPVEPWGERLEERVKVIRPGAWEVWTKTEGAGKKVEWQRTDEGSYDPDEVRVVRFTVGGLPLDDLAHLNRRHWESSSDQNNVLRVTRFPILAASGIRGEAADSIQIGPNKLLTTPAPDGKIYYVEHAGAAVEQGYKDLERLEGRMASYGAEFMKAQTSGPASASEAVLDHGEAISPLRSWVLDFKDCIERAMQLTGHWLGLGDDDAGSIDFDIDDGPDPAEGAHLQALEKARAGRDISRVAYLEGLKSRGILKEDYDPEEDQALIDDEAPPPGGLGGMFSGGPGTSPPAKKAPTVPPKE